MANEVKLPELGDGIESGDVLEVYVSEGDTVSKEQGLFELETDKATVTVPSPAAGKISRLMVSAGDTIEVGSVIMHIDSESGDSEVSSDQPQAEESPEAEADTPSDEAATKQSSEPEEETAQEPEEPAAAEQPAATSTPEPAASTSAAQTPPQSAPKQSAPPPDAPQPTAEPSAPAARDEQSPVPAGPAIRRLAREVGIDLRHVQGSGEGGRITREDVMQAVREANSSRTMSVSSPAAKEGASITKSTSATQATGKPLPGESSQGEYGPVRIERMSKIRKVIASQMHQSWTNVPRVTNFDDADVTELEALRKSSKDDYAAEGIKLTSMPFLIKAVSTALRHHPSMNAVIDMGKEQIVYRDYVNIGIAIDTERGLVVPNIRNVDAASISQIAKSLAELAGRVRTGDFGVNELRGGTFTISNLGAIGGTYSTPIVNIPEVAILLVGRTRKLPVVMPDDSIQPRQMMPLSLSYDHRLVDGGTAARFLNEVITYLENPSRMLLAIT